MCQLALAHPINSFAPRKPFYCDDTQRATSSWVLLGGGPVIVRFRTFLPMHVLGLRTIKVARQTEKKL